MYMESPTPIFQLSITVNHGKMKFPVNLETSTLGYFSGLTELESLLKSLSGLPASQYYYGKDIGFRIFEAKKFYLDQTSITMGHWVYDADGNLYGGYDGPDDTSFRGREASDCIFKPGEIVGFIECGGLEVGIILNLPMDPSTLLNRQEKVRERYGKVDNPPVFELDQSDDSYLVLTGPEKYDHAHPWVHHVFRMSKTIPMKKKELLQQLFEIDKAV